MRNDSPCVERRPSSFKPYLHTGSASKVAPTGVAARKRSQVADINVIMGSLVDPKNPSSETSPTSITHDLSEIPLESLSIAVPSFDTTWKPVSPPQQPLGTFHQASSPPTSIGPIAVGDGTHPPSVNSGLEDASCRPGDPVARFLD